MLYRASLAAAYPSQPPGFSCIVAAFAPADWAQTLLNEAYDIA